MTEELIHILEINYDPSDTDKAQQVAYLAIRLMRQAQLAVDAQDAGMKIGRDNAGSLQRAIIDMAKKLNLLPWFDDTETTKIFLSELRR